MHCRRVMHEYVNALNAACDHYVPEEAPTTTVELLDSFLSKTPVTAAP